MIHLLVVNQNSFDQHFVVIHLDLLAYDLIQSKLSRFHQLFQVMYDQLSQANKLEVVVNFRMMHSLHSVAMAMNKFHGKIIKKCNRIDIKIRN